MAVRLSVRHARSSASGEAPARYEFDQPRVVIGRGAGADVRLPALSVSEVHATLQSSERGFGVRDEGSTNGTRVNGSVVMPGRLSSLSHGDVLEVGEFSITFELGPSAPEPTTRERTASLARRLVRELMGAGATALDPPYLIGSAGAAQGKRWLISAAPSRMRIGRDDEAEIRIDDPDVSRFHAELEHDLDGLLIRDLDSRNGLFVNEKPVRERRLKHADSIGVGEARLVVEDAAERTVRSYEGQPDVPYERTVRLVPNADPADKSEKPAAPPNAAPEPGVRAQAQHPTNAARGLSADTVVYALAATVLAASVAGLFWLLKD